MEGGRGARTLGSMLRISLCPTTCAQTPRQANAPQLGARPWAPTEGRWRRNGPSHRRKPFEQAGDEGAVCANATRGAVVTTRCSSTNSEVTGCRPQEYLRASRRAEPQT